MNMMPTKTEAVRLENNIYDSLDIAVLINTRKVKGEQGEKEQRCIDQVAMFERLHRQNHDPTGSLRQILYRIVHHRMDLLFKNKFFLPPFREPQDLFRLIATLQFLVTQVIQTSISDTHIQETFNCRNKIKVRPFLPHLQESILHEIFNNLIILDILETIRLHGEIVSIKNLLENHTISSPELLY